MITFKLHHSYNGNPYFTYRDEEDNFHQIHKDNFEDNVYDLVKLLNEYEKKLNAKNNTISKLTMAVVDFHNRELATEKWGDNRPEFDLDKYYEVCMSKFKNQNSEEES